LIKWEVEELPPLTFAAYRVSAGLGVDARLKLRDSTARGILAFAIAQGLQFVELSLLPATTVTFLLNSTPVMVVALGIPLVVSTRGELWPSPIDRSHCDMARRGQFCVGLLPLEQRSSLRPSLRTLANSEHYAAQIALLAWVFLGEEMTAIEWTGIGLAIAGVTLV